MTLPLEPTVYFTSDIGEFNIPADGDLGQVELALEGLFARVYTNGVTPTSTVNLVDGYNNLTAPGNAKEVSAYRSVNQIHDHMRTWLPSFSDLDISLPVNIDVAGECNAFYDGSSVNFYDVGGGCNATSLIADVVYHEYGHAINDKFYQSLFAGFINGAMNEGYADLWAMSLADIAEIGKGFYTDNQDGIRVYDEDPKVYPEDIVGEVHADRRSFVALGTTPTCCWVAIGPRPWLCLWMRTPGCKPPWAMGKKGKRTLMCCSTSFKRTTTTTI